MMMMMMMMMIDDDDDDDDDDECNVNSQYLIKTFKHSVMVRVTVLKPSLSLGKVKGNKIGT